MFIKRSDQADFHVRVPIEMGGGEGHAQWGGAKKVKFIFSTRYCAENL